MNVVGGVYWVYIDLESNGGEPRIMEELNGMFPPHAADLGFDYLFVAIDSRTLALVPDGGN